MTAESEKITKSCRELRTCLFIKLKKFTKRFKKLRKE